MQIECLPVGRLPSELVARWDEIARSAPELASPYFRPEFTQVAGAISPEAAVAVFQRDATI